MMTAKKTIFSFAVMSLMLFVAGTAGAHWATGDGHKMHEPQLPDPDGWDIDMTNYTLADDWKCSETGLVDDIHFWYSVQDDISIDPFPPPHFTKVKVSTHDNEPEKGSPYSHPGTLLRSWEFDVDETMLNGPFPGNQGWDDPQPLANSQPNDHIWYWQLNITDISRQVDDPFTQQEGEIYWLDLQVQPISGTEQLVGWKTTEGIFMDDAVYQTPGVAPGWAPIAVCTANMPTDLAFVITPEPTTLGVLLLGGLAMLKHKRKKVSC